MPSWWIHGTHDVALLECVVKYGIGTQNQWEMLLNDDNCVFYVEGNGTPTNRPLKKKYLQDFLQDKQPLLSRLEYLVCLVLEGHAAAQPVHGKRGGTGSRAASGKRRAGGPTGDGDLWSPDSKKGKYAESDSGDGVLRFAVRQVNRGEDGTVILPINAKGATILSVGTVIFDRQNFHARNYIWPPGFKSVRKMPSIKSPGIQVQYTSEIIDNGDSPGFRVTPSDAPEYAMTFNTASRVWMEMLRKIKKRQQISVSGPEMYGYSDPTVKMLIQELPNSEKCDQYVWQNFEGSMTREEKVAKAAGVPVSHATQVAAPPAAVAVSKQPPVNSSAPTTRRSLQQQQQRQLRLQQQQQAIAAQKQQAAAQDFEVEEEVDEDESHHSPLPIQAPSTHKQSPVKPPAPPVNAASSSSASSVASSGSANRSTSRSRTPPANTSPPPPSMTAKPLPATASVPPAAATPPLQTVPNPRGRPPSRQKALEKAAALAQQQAQQHALTVAHAAKVAAEAHMAAQAAAAAEASAQVPPNYTFSDPLANVDMFLTPQYHANAPSQHKDDSQHRSSDGMDVDHDMLTGSSFSTASVVPAAMMAPPHDDDLGPLPELGDADELFDGL
jgi:hypothetical protein